MCNFLYFKCYIDRYYICYQYKKWWKQKYMRKEHKFWLITKIKIKEEKREGRSIILKFPTNMAQIHNHENII